MTESSFDDETKTSLLQDSLASQTSPKPAASRYLRIKVMVLASIGLLLLILAMFVVLISINLEIRWRFRENKPGFPIDPVPEFPIETLIFGPKDLYTAPRSPKTDAAWKALAGPTSSRKPWSQQGFILVHDWEKYDIPAGWPANGQMKYGISMFHQLHCLTAIREVFYDMLDGTFDKKKFLAADVNVGSPDFVPNGHGLWHVQHCFNYVRQGLQCAGDMSLEIPTYFNGTPIVVGWNSPHKCRSWDAMWRYAEENA
ncbi:hypothetical protein PRK78_005659 [Emydomyces testavorans]|uniref:Oxidase ustYa n=1 Tax=Emydomyces testavorans TaxID=2070801 RepID=A0AAF0DJZ8_9EURO|nr:hypothetical protein PRK78_005659 [Emydomyces testavorans]